MTVSYIGHKKAKAFKVCRQRCERGARKNCDKYVRRTQKYPFSRCVLKIFLTLQTIEGLESSFLILGGGLNFLVRVY